MFLMLHSVQKLKDKQLQLNQFSHAHQTGVHYCLGYKLNKASSLHYGRQPQMEEVQYLKSMRGTLQHHLKGLECLQEEVIHRYHFQGQRSKQPWVKENS